MTKIVFETPVDMTIELWKEIGGIKDTVKYLETALEAAEILAKDVK
jgi:hypothetical protein